MTVHDPRLNTWAWRHLRRHILDRDLGLCQIKGPGCTRYATCVDHIIDRADGGDMYNPANLRAACNLRRPTPRSGRRAASYLTGVARYATRL